TGYPFNVGGSGCSFANYIGCRVFLAPGRTLASSYKGGNRGISNWFDPTAFSQSPTAATFTGTPGNYVSGARPIPNLQGWVTRNVGRGPGTVSFDFSGIKNVKVTERVNVQFRAEAYNIINHGIFSNPNGSLGSPTGVGKISGTSMNNRSLQFAVKAMF
ncbi:MAG TPA: carboxypeptidase regulatory-like domain-containing protein, partial [Terriglobus sp.]